MREPKWRDDKCEKESRERWWDPLCQWVNRSTGLVNALNMNYFFPKYIFFNSATGLVNASNMNYFFPKYTFF